MRGASVAERPDRRAIRPGGGGARVDNEPAAAPGPGRGADGDLAARVRDAHAHPRPDDRRGRAGVQKGVRGVRRRRRRQERGRSESDQPGVFAGRRKLRLTTVLLTDMILKLCTITHDEETE